MPLDDSCGSSGPRFLASSAPSHSFLSPCPCNLSCLLAYLEEHHWLEGLWTRAWCPAPSSLALEEAEVAALRARLSPAVPTGGDSAPGPRECHLQAILQGLEVRAGVSLPLPPTHLLLLWPPVLRCPCPWSIKETSAFLALWLHCLPWANTPCPTSHPALPHAGWSRCVLCVLSHFSSV